MQSAEPIVAPEAQQCPGCAVRTTARRCGQCSAALFAGRYRTERLLSTSARGRVYVARTEDDRRVVLKELAFAVVPGVEQLTAFEREAAVLKRLSHPRIPRCIDSFEEGEGTQLRLYLVQEYVEGATLLQRLSERAFDEREAKHLAEQLLQILEYLHAPARRLLHRDIKPANLIIDRLGSLWLVDFGTVREVQGQATHRATIAGTFGYMPVEQLGGTVDDTSDLYAVGATLIHLLSGQHPSKLIGPDLTLDFARAISASPTMKAFIGRLVSIDRTKRFSSASEALKILRAPPPLPTKKRRIPLVAIGAVLLLVGLRLVVWWKPGLLVWTAAKVSPVAAPRTDVTGTPTVKPIGEWEKTSVRAQLLVPGPIASTRGQLYETGLLHVIDVEPMGALTFGDSVGAAARVTLRFLLRYPLKGGAKPKVPQLFLADEYERRYPEQLSLRTETTVNGETELSCTFHVRANFERATLLVGTGPQIDSVTYLPLTKTEHAR